MTILENPNDARISPEIAERFNHLERTIDALWSVEPACSVDERFDMTTRLSSISAAMERSRGSGHVDVAQLQECVEELAALTAEWFGMKARTA